MRLGDYSNFYFVAKKFWSEMFYSAWLRQRSGIMYIQCRRWCSRNALWRCGRVSSSGTDRRWPRRLLADRYGVRPCRGSGGTRSVLRIGELVICELTCELGRWLDVTSHACHVRFAKYCTGFAVRIVSSAGLMNLIAALLKAVAFVYLILLFLGNCLCQLAKILLSELV